MRALLAGAIVTLMLVSAAPAAAEPSEGTLACWMPDGVAGMSWPSEPIADDVLNGGSWDPLWLMDAETAVVQLQGDLVCGAADAGGGSRGVVASVVYSFEAIGLYTHSTCGTGHISGEFLLSGAGPSPTDLEGNLSIVQAAGAGKLTLTDLSGTLGLDVAHGGSFFQDVESGGGSGALTMVPAALTGGDCLTQPAFVWTVSGAFNVSFHAT